MTHTPSKGLRVKFDHYSITGLNRVSQLAQQKSYHQLLQMCHCQLINHLALGSAIPLKNSLKDPKESESA